MSRERVRLRRLAGGARSGIVGFGRFLANPRVTTDRLIEGWSAATTEAGAGRHVLAIQDTGEINFATTPEYRRGLGEIGKGVGRGAMAWRVVDWHRMRWTIEQFFRTLKQQGLQREDSQLERAERLVKLTAIAARAACVIMQLVHARDGRSAQDAAIAFTPPKSTRFKPCCPHWREKPPCRRIPTRPNLSLGPPGSSPNSAAGTAIQNPNPQDPSSSDTDCSASGPSPMDGRFEMCESPSRGGEREIRATLRTTHAARVSRRIAASPRPLTSLRRFSTFRELS